MKKNRIRIVAAFILTLAACSPGNYEKAAPGEPLCVAVGYDVSGSVAQSEMPVMTMEHVDKILTLVKKRGGCIAFGLIDEKAFEPLARVEIAQVSGKLDERARISKKNHQGASDFRALVEKKINRPRNAKRTDVNESIARMGLFFNEPSSVASGQKVALLITDGIDTGSWRNVKGIKLPKDVKVYVVGMEENLARKLFGQQAVLFEGIDSAVDSLSANSKKQVRS